MSCSFVLFRWFSVLLVLGIHSVSGVNSKDIASLLDKLYPYLPQPSYQVTRYRTGPYSACSRYTPCFDVTMSMVLDGVIERKFTMDKDLANEFVNQYKAVGFDIDGIIHTGRQAAARFQERFGVDFTGLAPTNYIMVGGSIPGVATFRPFILDRNGSYLLTMASYGEQVQFFNKRVDYGGWLLTFENDYNSTGTFKGVIPKRASLAIGSYVIRPCEGVPYGKCRNILNPANPSKPIFITIETRNPVSVQPDLSGSFDLNVRHKTFGVGRNVGAFYLNAVGKSVLRNILTFPKVRY